MGAQDADGRITRMLTRATPVMALRVVSGPSTRGGSGAPSFASIEWVGRAGHPSSYGLLGGALVDRSRIAVDEAGWRFRESLAGGSDLVTWGLATEYEGAVLEVLANQPQGVLVSQAAHGEVGSSVWVFERLALLLSRVLMAGVPSDDAELWKLVDRTWNGH